jgi:hypothetical protein
VRAAFFLGGLRNPVNGGGRFCPAAAGGVARR